MSFHRLVVAMLLTTSSPTLRALDDASHLDTVPVADVLAVPTDSDAAAKAIATYLARARDTHKRVTIGGTRHTMGGHTLSPGALYLDMLPHNTMRLDADKGLLYVGAGARWADIVPFLDARGFSPWVMQASNDFTVGGSLSANCHGWQADMPPINATVDRFTLITADGRLRTCSRTENRELFGLAMGGYGLFGVILDVVLRVVPNERYALTRTVLPADGYEAAFTRQVVGQPAVGMVYGRLSIAPSTFLRQGILNVFTRAPGAPPPALFTDALTPLKVALFHASARDDRMKEARWAAELALEPQGAGRFASRNQLCNESAALYADPDPAVTGILHEYYVPRGRLAAFLGRARQAFAARPANLLNVALRDVKRDDDTFLRYATTDMVAVVMYFQHPRTAAADARLGALTQDLIGAAIAEGGRHYLPYRLQATLRQFHQAYPQAPRFFALKRRYDPQEVFSNAFYERYGREGRTASSARAISGSRPARRSAIVGRTAIVGATPTPWSREPSWLSTWSPVQAKL